MKINQLAKKIHASNIKKGFWDKKRNEGEVLFLIITELAELLEIHRRSGFQPGSSELNYMNKIIKEEKRSVESKKAFFESYIKDFIGDELADAFIRMCDYCVGFNVRIDEFEIDRYANYFKKEKMKNLGEELLKISGHINFLRKNIAKEVTAQITFAHLIWLSKQLNVNLEKYVELKMWYNSTREKMHGKKC